MKKFAGLFFAAFVLFYAGSASAQSCNSPSGFIKAVGEFTVSDIVVFGPDCQSIQSGSAGTGITAITFTVLNFGVGGCFQAQNDVGVPKCILYVGNDSIQNATHLKSAGGGIELLNSSGTAFAYYQDVGPFAGVLTVAPFTATSLTTLPLYFQVLSGNSGAPITTGGRPTVAISRYEAIVSTATDGSDGPALYVRVQGASARQPVAIVGYGEATAAATSDVVGVYGVGINAGTGAAFAGFFATQNLSTGSNITIETDTRNLSGGNIPYNSTPGSKVATALDINYTSQGAGTFNGGPAIQIRAGVGKWDVGVAFMKGDFIQTASIQDDTNSVSLFITPTGAHTNGIDLSGGATYSGSPFKSTGFAVGNAGAVTALTYNKVTITQPATAATLTITNNKTLTVSNTLTFTGTDGSSVNFGAGGTVFYSITLSGDVTGSGSTAITTTLATAQPAVHTWALAQTFTVAPVFTDQSGTRTALGLGTAATQNTGTSGANLPFLNGTNTWSGANTWTLTQAANTTVDAIILNDTTAATLGNQQYSPALHFMGRGWATTSSTSKTVDGIFELRPVQGTVSPLASLVYKSQLDGGGYNDRMTIIDNGGAGLSVQFNGTGSAQFQILASGTQYGSIYADSTQFIVGTNASIPMLFKQVSTTVMTIATSNLVTFVAGIQTGAVAVGSLPTCNAGAKAERHFVTDANATFTAGIGAVVAAGGANNVPVTCDGTNWRIGANDNGITLEKSA